MKRVSIMSKLFVVIVGVLLVFASCQKDKTKYEVRIQNDMYNELSLLGVSSPWFKYDVVEFNLGGTVISDVPYGEFSEYVTIESTTDYELSVTVKLYTWNADAYSWDSNGEDTYDLGTESWADDQTYNKQKVKLQIGDLLQGYEPVYTVYGEE
jgi:uncharacterized protein YxeA